MVSPHDTGIADLTNLAGIACLHLAYAELTDEPPSPLSIYVSTRNLNSDAHTSTASPAPAEPCPQPSFVSIYILGLQVG